MKVKPLHPDFTMPTKGTKLAGAYDLFMPEAGFVAPGTVARVNLGFATEVPENHVALILPRSGVGTRNGLALRNTCGVIDSDYRGEWVAALYLKNPERSLRWAQGDRLLQMLIVPIANVELVLADELADTARGAGGFGSTGQ